MGGKVVSVAHADHIWAILEAARQSASVSIASEGVASQTRMSEAIFASSVSLLASFPPPYFGGLVY